LTNLLANIIMLTSASNKRISNRPPSDYLQEVEAALGDRFENAMAANLISPRAVEAAKDNDYGAFLKERSFAIDAAMSELTGW
jgi:hypothetical protein